jgi:hypothetical protein
VVTSFVTIFIRRVCPRNPRRRIGYSNSYPIGVPPGGRPFNPPPMPFAQPPVRPVQFPSPSIPPVDPTPPYYAPPRHPRPSTDSGAPAFPNAQYLSPGVVQSSAASDLSRGPSMASSSLFTNDQRSVPPPAPSVSSPTSDPYDDQAGGSSQHAIATSVPPPASRPALGEEMTSHQKQLMADQEKRHNAINTPSEPPPQYSE